MTDDNRSIEKGSPFFRGGEERGEYLRREDIERVLVDTLQSVLYSHVRPRVSPQVSADRVYRENESFWRDALSGRHFPGVYITLDEFTLIEWLPLAPGRYYTPGAEHERERASRAISRSRSEYLPEGKASMVRGGIGAIRLAEKTVRGSTLYFLGASSSGIAHQGIPIALPSEEYRRVMPLIKERGGCKVRVVGTLLTLTEEMPTLYYDSRVPRYCLLVEELSIGGPSHSADLLVSVAIMFTSGETSGHRRWQARANDDPMIVNKSWSFCSFSPGEYGRDAHLAAEWLMGYADRYSNGNPKILTDFDEQYRLFTCPVEFPLADIVRGSVDWETLRVYQRHFGNTYIETYIREYTSVTGDQINAQGSGNTVVNRSVVQNAFNRVRNEYDEETAEALKRVAEEIDRAGNTVAAENFEAFSTELQNPKPKKSLLSTLWQGTVAALPVIKELPDVVAKIMKLFS